MLLASANDGDATGVGVIGLIVLIALLWLIFGDHDPRKKNRP